MTITVFKKKIILPTLDRIEKDKVINHHSLSLIA